MDPYSDAKEFSGIEGEHVFFFQFSFFFFFLSKKKNDVSAFVSLKTSKDQQQISGEPKER